MYYKVTFKYSETTYCTNIAAAKNEDAIRNHYKKYEILNISEANDYDIKDAKRKGMPIVNCD